MSSSGKAVGGAAISREEMMAVRRQMQSQFAAIPLAFSIDGKTFAYEAPLDYPIPAGSYVHIETPENQSYLGQIISKSIDSREGPELVIDVGTRFNIALEGAGVSQATIRPDIRYLAGDGILLGKVMDGALIELETSDIFESAEIAPAPADLINLYLAGTSGETALAIGKAMYGDDSSVATLRAGGFNRHTFLCGQSGSGKTYSLGVVLEQLLLRTDLQLVVIDPNSDFVRLPELRDGAIASHDPADLERFESISDRIRIVRPDTFGRSSASGVSLR